MNVTDVGLIIKGNLEAIEQGVQLLSRVSDDQYVYVAEPYISSSMGEHFRHIVDIFYAVMNGIESGVIDYDVRKRGALIESNRKQAQKELEGVGLWMGKFWEYVQGALVDAEKPVMVISEVSLKDTDSVKVDSTFIREMVFASSHAVHHFALISVIAKLQKIVVESDLGVAPSTATYLRHKSQSSH